MSIMILFKISHQITCMLCDHIFALERTVCAGPMFWILKISDPLIEK